MHEDFLTLLGPWPGCYNANANGAYMQTHPFCWRGEKEENKLHRGSQHRPADGGPRRTISVYTLV